MPLIGNRVIEKQLRSYLNDHGYASQTAQFSRIDLVAIQRPGWVQVFAFEVRAKERNGGWNNLLGICRDDERFKQFEVEFGKEPDVCRDQLATWTTDLITLDRPPRHWLQTALLALFLVVLLAVSLIALFA